MRPPDSKRPETLALMLDEVVANLNAYDLLREVFDEDSVQRDLEALADYLREHTFMDASIYGGVFGVRS